MQRPHLYLPNLYPFPSKIVPVLLWDCKKPDDRHPDKQTYWRHDYLPSYKGKRKARSTAVSTLAEQVKHYWNLAGMLSYGEDGFEADDWAGLIVKTRPENGRVILVTLDSDWGQLISDRVHWVDVFSRSKMRNNGADPSQTMNLLGPTEFIEKINNHKSMGSWPISQPSDLVDNKWALGDDADRIPRGSVEGLRGIIDLTHPIVEIPGSNIDVWSVDWSPPTPGRVGQFACGTMVGIPDVTRGGINYNTGKVYQTIPFNYLSEPEEDFSPYDTRMTPV
jgi:hypothetical protein